MRGGVAFWPHKNGFYAYAKPNLCNTDTVIKYISRYLGRPVIASSRIDSYDGEYVTFHYNKHEDNSYVERTIPVQDFISLLIQHIPEKHFKMTRYYGLYARHRKLDEKLRRAILKSRHRILLDFNKWRQLILLSFGYDPLQWQMYLILFPICFILKVSADRRHTMDPQFIEGLRQKYIKNPPEGMTAKLVKNMTDSDLLDMHYFLTEDDDLDEDEFEEGFYIF